ncbi:hypothetical protein K1719_036378 [Acacia pycnantha]|nr:hypothetical protein K1719_036378 [Acacia pycnantha]
MDENLKPGIETWISASKVVRSASEANGCYYVMSNKISRELQTSVLDVLEELFDLPLKTKKQETSADSLRYRIDVDGLSGKMSVEKLALSVSNGDVHQAAF